MANGVHELTTPMPGLVFRVVLANYFECISTSPAPSTAGVLPNSCIASLIYIAITCRNGWGGLEKSLKTVAHSACIHIISYYTADIFYKFNRICGDLFFFDLHIELSLCPGVPRITFCSQRLHVYIMRQYNRTRQSQQEKFI